MKRKLLQLSLLTIVFGLTGLIVASGYVASDQPASSKSKKGNAGAMEYLHQIRSNQITGEINSNDVLKAREQAEKDHLKSGSVLGLEWNFVGPDNAPGRVRAMIFDKQDATAKTIIAAGITGGLWKTTNLGATWNKINTANQNLYVSCLAQTADGTIYAGTGEYFCTEEETYTGGLVGQGLFKSTNGVDFSVISGTEPQITTNNDTVEWAYINKIAVDKNSGRVYVATNAGLWYSNDGNNNWAKLNKYYLDTMTYNVTLSVDSTVMCDSYEVVGNNIIMQNPQYNQAQVDTTSYTKENQAPLRTVMEFGKINCSDVEIGADGTVVATFGDMVYIADGSDNMVFTNKSGTPANPVLITREDRDFTTTLIAVDTIGTSASRTITFNQITDYVPDPALGRTSPLANNPGRANVAFAPSDETGNIIYAVSTQAGFLYNVYISEDKGETWEIILPGGSTTLRPFNGTACFNNTFVVFPNDPYKVLLGGLTMWLGQRIAGTSGFFDWGLGPVTAYLPVGHHLYEFQPGTNNKIAVTTNNGIYYGTVEAGSNDFIGINRNFAITQSYTVGVGGIKRKFITGVQGDGTWFVNGLGNTTQYGYPIDFGDGGSCAISVINPDAFFYSNSTGVIQRSDDEGQNTSFNFAAPTSNLFITPVALWESFESENSRDSITFKALQTYYQGDVLLCRSDNAGFGLDAGYPFNYVLEQDSLVAGDSLRIKDIIQSKLFVATHNAVYMTKDAVKFDKDTEWWQISTVATANGSPSCMAYSKDADQLYIGTQTGVIMRIANIAFAYDYDRADVASPYCIISTDIIQIPEFTGRFITSISVDPNNENHLIVTLGNYGNQGYVYRTTNALASPASDIVFTDITSNLPKMPVYSSMIEMNNSSIALIGTEYGVYTTSDLSNPSLTWTAENNGVGMIPVFQIKQQIIYKNEIVIPSEDPTTPPLVYPKVDNWGTIYIATYGRGVFRDDTYEIVGITDPKTSGNSVYKMLSVYPNPVNNEITCSFELFHGGDLTLMVYSSDGRLMKEYHAGMFAAGKHTIRLDCSDLINGVYIVKVKTGEESFTSKMIVQ